VTSAPDRGAPFASPSRAPSALRAAATALAREAGAILLEGYGRAHRPERKGRIDLVTEYDRRSEALLLDRLRERFPGDTVFAEESGVHAGTAGNVRWLVDPLDGTTNFAHNYPFFAVSIAAEVGGRLTAAAVYDPVRDEMFDAAAGDGAALNGRPIRVTDVDRLEDALLVTGFPYSIREDPEPTLRLFRAFLVRAQGIRRDGSAALNLCYLACGRFDGFWETDLSPWDMAAGVLIVREAGGLVTGFGDEEFRVEVPRILASNGALHDAMREVMTSATTK
jgi:myo-inositol-1(or 4)-monophosphatase